MLSPQQSSLTILVMVAIEFVEVSISTLSKVAMTKGISQYIYVFYCDLLGILVLLPSSLIFYRTRTRPQLKFPIILRISLLGLISCSIQLLMNAGIKYSSPILSAAMTDLIPAFTFLLALISRMEKLDLKLRSSQAKSIGTILSIAGALMVTFYKGHSIVKSITSLNNSSPNQHLFLLSLLPSSNWIIGGIFCACGAFFISLLYIVQTWITKDYPAELHITLISCTVATPFSAIVALIAERDLNAWKLKPDVALISITLSAIFQVSLRSVVHTWACRMKGPVFTAMFKPLGIVIAVILGVLFLGDTLYIGSVIGGIVIASGFYAVIWGKAQEQKVFVQVNENDHDSESSTKVSLLQNEINNV